MSEYTPDPKGLYDKYTVFHQDGTPVEGPTFLLRVADPHARAAMLAYARSVVSENRKLANDLCRVVGNWQGVQWDELPYYGCRDEYAAIIELADEMQAESKLSAADSLAERYEQMRRAPIKVQGLDGNIVAVVVNEYEPGYPGDPGHDYWRFASLEEALEVIK